MPNVSQLECLPLDPLSEPGVDPHDRSSANLSESDECRFPDACVISWNMNGIQNFEKLRTLQKMAGSCQPLFILIQESHSDFECDLNLIKNQLRKYIWLKDNSSGKRRGLLIGVRWMEEVKEISSCFFDQTMSGLFGVHVTIGSTNYSVLNIYCHPDLKVAIILQEAAHFFGQNPRSINIFGGDFNWDVKEKQMGEIEKCCASLHMSHLKWDEPTHYKGRCIDHIFFSSKAPLKHLFINTISSGFKDHALLIGGSLFKEWEIWANKKSIPKYLINNHGFINTLIERMGTFSKGDDPNEFLTRFKTTA